MDNQTTTMIQYKSMSIQVIKLIMLKYLSNKKCHFISYNSDIRITILTFLSLLQVNVKLPRINK